MRSILLQAALGLFLFTTTCGYAQTECFTPTVVDPVNALPPFLPCASFGVTDATNNADYIPLPTDEIETVRVILHIVQRSDGSDNFDQNNPTHVSYLQSMFNPPGMPGGPSVNDIYGNIQPQIHSGVTDPLVVSDSRVRFQLVDILYHPDNIGFYNNSHCMNCCQVCGVPPHEYLGTCSECHDCIAWGGYLHSTYDVEPCKYLNVIIFGTFCDSYQLTAGVGYSSGVMMMNVYSNYVQHGITPEHPYGGTRSPLMVCWRMSLDMRLASTILGKLVHNFRIWHARLVTRLNRWVGALQKIHRPTHRIHPA